MTVPTATPQQLFEHLSTGVVVDLIDVRTPAEFRDVHVDSARNIPLDQLNPSSLITHRQAPQQPLFVICQSGTRGRLACERIIATGCDNIVNIDGGMQAWVQAGLPVILGKKAISLERQVRIAAGSLVLLGLVLGLFVSAYWIGLSAFIGAGLVFSGITDTCGMGMMLARMPWNQVDSSPHRDASRQAKNSSTPAACSINRTESC